MWANWEQLKALEKTGRARSSKLDGIPDALGALAARAEDAGEGGARRLRLDRRARQITEKLAEELRRTRRRARAAGRDRPDDAHVREELGDVLFTVVNLARRLGIDAEGAMRDANAKFDRRFRYMETSRRSRSGRELDDMSLDELEELWQQAKTAA